MTDYLLYPAAAADLEEIYDYTEKRWGAAQAEQYVRDVQHAIERAAANPDRGREVGDIRPGYRRFATGSHSVYYRLTGDGVIAIVRILHQRMDPDRHL